MSAATVYPVWVVSSFCVLEKAIILEVLEDKALGVVANQFTAR